MDYIHSLVQWYQSKISSYDKQLWEKSVEETVLKSIDKVPKKDAKFKTDLIDVDLVRGSTFPKAKPKHGFIGTSQRGILRVVFFPLFLSWWGHQTSSRFVAALLLVYCMQVLATVVYYLYSDYISPEISLAHLLAPMVMLLVLGLIHAHIIATHESHPRKSRRTASKKSPRKKSSKKKRRVVRPDINGHIPSQEEPDTAASAVEGLRKRVLCFHDEVTTLAPTIPPTGLIPETQQVNGQELMKEDLEKEAESGPEAGLKAGLEPEPSEVFRKSCMKEIKQISSGDVSRISSKGVVKNSDSDIRRISRKDLKRNSLKERARKEIVWESSEDTTEDSHNTSSVVEGNSSELGSDPPTSQCTPLVATEEDEEDGEPRESLFKPDSFPEAFNRQSPNRLSSSGESETETPPNTPNKANSSEMEWDEMNSGDMTSDSSSACGSDGLHRNVQSCDPQEDDISAQRANSIMNNLANSSDRVSCIIWENDEAKKVDLTVLDLGWTIINKVDLIAEISDYVILGLILAAVSASLPLLYRVHLYKSQLLSGDIRRIVAILVGTQWPQALVIINGVIQRFLASLIFFFLLSVAEKTFKQRLLYAKHFCYLTSARRARKYSMPHFRLNKVRNIKTWLSLRAYLKKRGPQRSVDAIVSSAFILAIISLSLISVELLHDAAGFFEHLGNWELVFWSLALACFLLRFMTLGTKVNRKYRSFSVLITEQINLYLHLEKKPSKKEELTLANNVLKLAEALLKELENPFKISGLLVNPLLYNITKLVLLSAFSAVLTEMLGFKLKLYKIKLP